MLGGLLMACLATALLTWPSLASRGMLFDLRTRAFGEVAYVIAFGTLEVCYMAVFLGIGLLFNRLTRRLGRASPSLSVLTQMILVLLCCGVPWVIQKSSSDWYRSDYNLLHVSNVFWTLAELGSAGASWAYMPAVLVILGSVALVVFVMNLPAIAREVRFVRIAKPRRLTEEEAQEEALRRPPQPVQVSPWDVQMPPVRGDGPS